MTEKRKPSHTSDAAADKLSDGKEGLERMAGLMRRILKVPRVPRQPTRGPR